MFDTMQVGRRIRQVMKSMAYAPYEMGNARTALDYARRQRPKKKEPPLESYSKGQSLCRMRCSP